MEYKILSDWQLSAEMLLAEDWEIVPEMLLEWGGEDKSKLEQ
jgi:hypothetical protein